MRLENRFIVHCFKHDFESLILAAEASLLKRLNRATFPRTIDWVRPVEDQDRDNPPKRIVEALFRESGRKYKDTIDAPYILERADYEDIMQKCPQNFKPFVENLRAIVDLT